MALSTNFTFSCDRWTDSESPLDYEFFYDGNQSQTVFSSVSSPSGTSVNKTAWLVAGDETNNYTLTVGFTVKDSLGSKTLQYFDVQVFNGSASSQIGWLLLMQMIIQERTFETRKIHNAMLRQH